MAEGILRRAAVLWASCRLEWRLRRLRLEERAALRCCGEELRSAGPALLLQGTAASTFAQVTLLLTRQRELGERLAASLEVDRADYRAARTELARGLIVARGILDRLMLREAVRRARRELPERLVELGAAAVADERAAEPLSHAARMRVEAARTALQAASRERELLLAPYGGEAAPRVLRTLGRELVTFLSFVKEELARKLLLRLPALAAMAVTWWITHRWTISHFERQVNRLFGRDEGPSETTVRWLSFWLPILAAALVAYALQALRQRLRERYLAGTASEVRREDTRQP